MSLPDALQEQAARAFERVPRRDVVAAWPEAERVLACSEFITATLAADPDIVDDWEARDWNTPGTRGFYDRRLGELLEDSRPEGRSYEGRSDGGRSHEEVLRRFRKAEAARIAWRDLAGLADLETNLLELSDLADACITTTVRLAEDDLVQRYGVPRDQAGRRQRMVVLAMGKLGAHELNFSSDVDLVFTYPESGDTDGDKPVTNEEFFTRVGRRVIQLLDQVTADGFVYRVDMRLRPFGDSGPLALSFNAMESYYQEHGRDWERYAFIKARPVGGELADGVQLLRALRPFVFRRYLDYGSFEQLRRMKAKIEREVAQRELADNIKLGPGGIREVEFIGQAFQLIRGGREPDLQERRILRVLDLLVAHRHLGAERVQVLKSAYGFLRRAENRLQAQEDQQEHELPEEPLARARLACAMGFADWPAFVTELESIRAAVTREFESVFFGPQQPASELSPVASIWREERSESAAERLAAAGFEDPAHVLERLTRLRDGVYWRMMGDTGRARLDQLLPMLLDRAAESARPALTLERLLRIVESIDRRIAYLALLIENPKALGRLATLCADSSLVTDRIARAPLLLDELLDSRIFTEAPTRASLTAELTEMFDGLPDDDLERQMDALRTFQQAAVLRLAVADLTDLLPLMKVSDRLTEIAEIVLERALAVAWHHMSQRHGEPGCNFGIVAYGKLGGLELAYGSDLDLVFLHDCENIDTETDGERPLALPVFFSRLGQRIVHLLATPTAAGVLYQVDTRLRPSGSSGPLVSGIKAFEEYQRDEAWTWEHQALLRARPVAGGAAIEDAFTRVRREVLARRRDAGELKAQVAEMRARMRTELGSSGGAGRFDLKQDSGGIADVEFLVQYLVLANAADHPALLEWTDNIRQLEGLVEARVLDAENGAALIDAYKRLRERVHRLGLQGEAAVVDDDEFVAERALVTALWARIISAS